MYNYKCLYHLANFGMSNRVYAKKGGSDPSTSKIDEIIAAIGYDDIPLLKSLTNILFKIKLIRITI